MQQPGRHRSQNGPGYATDTAGSDHDEVGVSSGHRQRLTSAVEHNAALSPPSWIDVVDGSKKTLAGLVKDVRISLLNRLWPKPRNKIDRDEGSDLSVGWGHVQRPTQRRCGVIAAVKSNDDSAARSSCPTRRDHHGRPVGVCRQILTDRTQQAVFEVADSTSSDHDAGLRVGFAKQHGRRMPFENARLSNDPCRVIDSVDCC